MKLYTYDPAPNPQRLRHFMAYKGIDIETLQVDLMKGEHRGEEYLAINPAGTVPALVLDDNTLLNEVIGICAYLEAFFPEKPLMGNTPVEKAEVISWDHRLFTTVMSAVADTLRNGSPGFVNRALPGPLDVPQIPELVERGKLRLDYIWPVLDAELAEREWLAGDSFSLADIDLLVCGEFAGWVKCQPGEQCKNLQAHAERVRQAVTPA